MENTEEETKQTESSKKQKRVCSPGNYLHSIYIVLGIKKSRDDLKYTGGGA